MTTKLPTRLRLDETAWYTPHEAAAVLRCSRSFIYELLARQDLKSVKNGRKRLVPGTSIAAYLDSLTNGASEYVDASERAGRGPLRTS